MIKIKISADNERLLQKAKTESELRGAVDLILERVSQAKASAVFGKEPAPAEREQLKRYNWRTAKEVLGRVLGDQLRHPPFPDPIWYQRIHRTLKTYDMTEEKLTELAEYAKDRLKPPYSLDFLVCQHERILAGNFDTGGKRGAGASGSSGVLDGWRKNVLPEE